MSEVQWDGDDSHADEPREGDRADRLPSPLVSVWMTLGALLIGGLVLLVALEPEQRAAAAFPVGLIVMAVGATYVFSLASLRELTGRLEERFPESTVFTIASTSALKHTLRPFSGRDRVRLGQYAGVTADLQGFAVWARGASPEPVARFDWSEVAGIGAVGAPILFFRVPSVAVTGRRQGFPFRIVLPLYSAGTAYPVSRKRFAESLRSLRAWRHTSGAEGSTYSGGSEHAGSRLTGLLALAAMIAVGAAVGSGWGGTALNLAQDAAGSLFPDQSAVDQVAYAPTEEGALSVSFPGDPTVATEEQSISGRSVALTEAVWETRDMYLSAGSAPLADLIPDVWDASMLTPEETDALLTVSLDGAVAAIANGEVVREEYGDVDGVRSISATVLAGTAGECTVVIAVHGRVLQTVIAAGDDEDGKARFVDSFHLAPSTSADPGA